MVDYNGLLSVVSERVGEPVLYIGHVENIFSYLSAVSRYRLKQNLSQSSVNPNGDELKNYGFKRNSRFKVYRASGVWEHFQRTAKRLRRDLNASGVQTFADVLEHKWHTKPCQS